MKTSGKVILASAFAIMFCIISCRKHHCEPQYPNSSTTDSTYQNLGNPIDSTYQNPENPVDSSFTSPDTPNDSTENRFR